MKRNSKKIATNQVSHLCFLLICLCSGLSEISQDIKVVLGFLFVWGVGGSIYRKNSGKMKNFSGKNELNLGFQGCFDRFCIIFGLWYSEKSNENRTFFERELKKELAIWFFSGKKEKIRAKRRQPPKNNCSRTPMIDNMERGHIFFIFCQREYFYSICSGSIK